MIFRISRGKTPLTSTRLTTRVVARDPSVCDGSDSNSSPLCVKLLHVLEWALFYNPLKFADISISLAPFTTFFHHFFLLYRILRAANFGSSDLLWLVIAHDVSDHDLDNCEVSSGSNDCVAY